MRAFLLFVVKITLFRLRWVNSRPFLYSYENVRPVMTSLRSSQNPLGEPC